MTLPNNDFGTTAFLQVKVWDFSTSSTYEAAVGKTGAGNVFTYKVPAAGDLLLSDYVMEGFGSFAGRRRDHQEFAGAASADLAELEN